MSRFEIIWKKKINYNATCRVYFCTFLFQNIPELSEICSRREKCEEFLKKYQLAFQQLTLNGKYNTKFDVCHTFYEKKKHFDGQLDIVQGYKWIRKNWLALLNSEMLAISDFSIVSKNCWTYSDKHDSTGCSKNNSNALKSDEILKPLWDIVGNMMQKLVARKTHCLPAYRRRSQPVKHGHVDIERVVVSWEFWMECFFPWSAKLEQ